MTGQHSLRQSKAVAARAISRVDARIQKMKSRAIAADVVAGPGVGPGMRSQKMGSLRGRVRSSAGSTVIRGSQFHVRGSGVGLSVVVRLFRLFGVDGEGEMR